jgi:hypothetical protein
MVRIAAPKNNLQNSVFTGVKSGGGDEPFTGKSAIGYDHGYDGELSTSA